MTWQSERPDSGEVRPDAMCGWCLTSIAPHRLCRRFIWLSQQRYWSECTCPGCYPDAERPDEEARDRPRRTPLAGGTPPGRGR